MIEGPVRQAGVGVGCAALGWAVVAGLYHLVGAPIAFFFLLVTFTAALIADRAGGVTAILSSITSVYYFTEPVGWRMTPSGAISIVIFLAASGAMVEVITRMHAAIVARDALMSVVSHDLRTPLSSLSLREQRLLLTLEKQGPPPPDELRRHAESALHLIRGLASMIENLLDLGRLHSRHLELAPADADLARIVGNVVGDMLPAINAAGSRLDTAGFDQPCPGFWDAVAMERVVGNLLSNAIKYGDGKPIEVTLEKDVKRVRLAVVDHGIGIAADEQARVFDRFEQAAGGKGRPHSHGLGLWIVRRLVQAHGGTVALESQVGQGTTVIVTVPRMATRARLGAGHRVSFRHRQRGSARTLSLRGR